MLIPTDYLLSPCNSKSAAGEDFALAETFFALAESLAPSARFTHLRIFDHNSSIFNLGNRRLLKDIRHPFTLKSKKIHKYLFFQSKIYNFAACYLILSANG